MFDINWGILSVVFMWSSLWKEIDLLILELFLTRASICLCGTIFIFLCEANTLVSAICWGRIGTSSSSCLVTLKTILGFCARAPVRPSWKDAVHSTWKNIFDRSALKRIEFYLFSSLILHKYCKWVCFHYLRIYRTTAWTWFAGGGFVTFEYLTPICNLSQSDWLILCWYRRDIS